MKVEIIGYGPVCGSFGTLRPGTVHDLDDRIAKPLVANRRAVEVDSRGNRKPRVAQEPEVETASSNPTGRGKKS